MNIYVGNMSFDTTEDQLREAFGGFGQVTSVNIISDRDSGRPKGFGFVEMASKDEAMAAISGLNGRELNGRTLNVNEARPREDRGGSGGGGNRGGNRGGGGGYRNRY
jgi:RNA recognition motif-containing protein